MHHRQFVDFRDGTEIHLIFGAQQFPGGGHGSGANTKNLGHGQQKPWRKPVAVVEIEVVNTSHEEIPSIFGRQLLHLPLVAITLSIGCHGDGVLLVEHLVCEVGVYFVVKDKRRFEWLE